MGLKTNIVDFHSGDNIEWLISSDEFLSTDGINLKIVLISSVNPKIEITCNNETDGTWSISKQPTITDQWLLGKYSIYFVFYNSLINFAKQINGGSIEILPNILNLDKFDFRSENQKLLDVVRERIAGRLVDTMNSFTINGRSVTLMSMSELLEVEKVLIARVNNELAQADKKSKGKTNRNKLSIRYKGVL